jgi:hypothetical protein
MKGREATLPACHFPNCKAAATHQVGWSGTPKGLSVPAQTWEDLHVCRDHVDVPPGHLLDPGTINVLKAHFGPGLLMTYREIPPEPTGEQRPRE